MHQRNIPYLLSLGLSWMTERRRSRMNEKCDLDKRRRQGMEPSGLHPVNHPTHRTPYIFSTRQDYSIRELELCRGLKKPVSNTPDWGWRALYKCKIIYCNVNIKIYIYKKFKVSLYCSIGIAMLIYVFENLNFLNLKLKFGDIN